MSSVKSVYGHTEGAAGLTGLLLAHAQIQSNCQPAVMHLRGLNPYVQAALQDWKKSQSAEAVIQRQCSPVIAGYACGTSSFGMSGINCHVILEPSRAGPVTELVGVAEVVAWRRVRCWPSPTTFALLQFVRPAGDAVHFSCSSLTARLAFLKDFEVSLLKIATAASSVLHLS